MRGRDRAAQIRVPWHRLARELHVTLTPHPTGRRFRPLRPLGRLSPFRTRHSTFKKEVPHHAAVVKNTFKRSIILSTLSAICCIVLFATLGLVESATTQATKRTFENKIPPHVPLKIKIKKEKRIKRW